MKSFAKKLEKLVPNDAESRLERHCKKIKAFLNEKELAQMSAVVVRHTMGLNLYLKTLERYALSCLELCLLLTHVCCSDTLFEVYDELRAAHQTLRES